MSPKAGPQTGRRWSPPDQVEARLEPAKPPHPFLTVRAALGDCVATEAGWATAAAATAAAAAAGVTGGVGWDPSRGRRSSRASR